MNFLGLRKFHNLQNFASYEISQVAKFRNLGIFKICFLFAIVHPTTLFISHALFTILFFDVLTHFVPFLIFFPILFLVIAFDFGSFCNFAWLGQYISSHFIHHCKKITFCSLINLAGSFQLSRSFLAYLLFSPFLSLSGQPNTLRG